MNLALTDQCRMALGKRTDDATTKSKKFVALSPSPFRTFPPSPSFPSFAVRERDEMGDRIELTHYYTVVLHKGGGGGGHPAADGNELEKERKPKAG